MDSKRTFLAKIKNLIKAICPPTNTTKILRRRTYVQNFVKNDKAFGHYRSHQSYTYTQTDTFFSLSLSKWIPLAQSNKSTNYYSALLNANYFTVTYYCTIISLHAKLKYTFERQWLESSTLTEIVNVDHALDFVYT